MSIQYLPLTRPRLESLPGDGGWCTRPAGRACQPPWASKLPLSGGSAAAAAASRHAPTSLSHSLPRGTRPGGLRKGGPAVVGRRGAAGAAAAAADDASSAAKVRVCKREVER